MLRPAQKRRQSMRAAIAYSRAFATRPTAGQGWLPLAARVSALGRERSLVTVSFRPIPDAGETSHHIGQAGPFNPRQSPHPKEKWALRMPVYFAIRIGHWTLN